MLLKDLKNMSTYSLKRYDNIHLLNILLIAYAFFTPISTKISTFILFSIEVLLLFQYDLKNRFMLTIKDKVIQAFLLFYLMHILWSIGNNFDKYAQFKLNDYQFIFGILVITMVFQKKYFDKILLGLISGVLFSELVSYSMALGIQPSFLHLTQGMGNVPFMEHYTPYSTILSISLGLILYNLITKENQTLYTKSIYLLFFTSASFNIFIISSRIGYALYAVSITTILLYLYRRQLKKILFFGMILLVSGYTLAYNFSPLFKDRIIQAYHDIQGLSDNNLHTSLGARTGYWIYGIESIKNHPFFGVGTNEHILTVKKIIIDQEACEQNKQALLGCIPNNENSSLHSEYLDILVQFGLIGLVVFLNIFYQLARYQQVDRNQKIIQIILITTILTLCIGSVIFRFDELARAFILLSAISLHSYEERRKVAI